MKEMLGINSIYFATEGEGVNIGTPQIFVRFQGCSKACRNCDSKETWKFCSLEQMTSLSDVLSQIEQIADDNGGIQRVSITGGDPLDPKHRSGLLSLISALKKNDYFVHLEVAGDIVANEVFDVVDFFSIDYKTPSSGVETNLDDLCFVIKQFGSRIQIKSVIQDREDFDYVRSAFSKVTEKLGALSSPWCLTPCYNSNETFPRERFVSVLEWNQKAGGKFRVIGQQHKWFFGPDVRDV